MWSRLHAQANHPQCPFVDSVRRFQREAWLAQPLENPLHASRLLYVASEPSIAYLPCGALRLSNDVPLDLTSKPRGRAREFRKRPVV